MSERFTLDKEQAQSLLRACFKYTAPLLLLFLLQVQQGVELKQALVIVYGAILQLAINFLSKFVSES